MIGAYYELLGIFQQGSPFSDPPIFFFSKSYNHCDLLLLVLKFVVLTGSAIRSLLMTVVSPDKLYNISFQTLDD